MSTRGPCGYRAKLWWAEANGEGRVREPAATPFQPLAGLLGLVAAAVTAFGTVPAAAATGVESSTPVMINTVGYSTDIAAGHRPVKAVPRPGFVVATCVAAESMPLTLDELYAQGAQLDRN
jgi:hypothetical protein